MGGIHGMFLAQYEVLRERGHSPSEAFNETVEEATQSLYPLIGANGMDWMYAACSTTARRGAIDWSGRFKDTLKPVFNDLYDSVEAGKETKRSLEFNSQPDYRERFEEEMKEIRELEIWRAGKAVRYVSSSLFVSEILRLSPVADNSVRKTRSRVINTWGLASFHVIYLGILYDTKTLKCAKVILEIVSLSMKVLAKPNTTVSLHPIIDQLPKAAYFCIHT